MLTITIGVIYMTIGIVLALPYCALAGWNPSNFIFVSFVAPALLFIWFMISIFAGIIKLDENERLRLNLPAAFRRCDNRPLRGSLLIFWGWAFWLSLPIISHWGAFLLEKNGHAEIALLINTHRYATPFYALLIALVLSILVVVISATTDKTKRALARAMRR